MPLDADIATRLKDPTLLKADGFVDGAWSAAASGARFAVTNPATGETIAEVADMGAGETKAAITAADAAWKPWERRLAKERAAVLRKWFELIMAAQDDLAAIATAECGKPLAEAKGEVAYAASFIEWFAEEAKRVYGDTIPQHQPDKRIVVIKQPIGVVGAITPWNFPIAMITRKCAPALAVGCPVVVKPAEQTPLSALALAVLAERAGFPKGVFNVIVGLDGPAIGKELTGSDLVRKIAFTGSTEVGRILMKASADSIKKVSLELGGNAPFIVFDDADLDAAVEGAMASKFRNAGQTCVCANRIYVQDGIYDRFAEAFAQKVAALKVGNGAEPGSQVGPLIETAGVEKVKAHLADAAGQGAKVVVGGHPHAAGPLFFEPTVLTGVTQSMKVAREETFGPLAPLFRFHTEEEAIEMANATEFGLAAYFYARDLGRVWRVSEGLDYGMVGVNAGILATEVAPFGGVKQSGLGREGSKYGLDEFLEVKYILMGGV
ncbi:MAG: NAD-dependent succinate-semialdehyde dehydrogenase [Rhodobacteraceae bacterium]|nr:NAD-dependent succinate-semialdehyde dehydrogenase [Paracoccaceae bacterium]